MVQGADSSIPYQQKNEKLNEPLPENLDPQKEKIKQKGIEILSGYGDAMKISQGSASSDLSAINAKKLDMPDPNADEIWGIAEDVFDVPTLDPRVEEANIMQIVQTQKQKKELSEATSQSLKNNIEVKHETVKHKTEENVSLNQISDIEHSLAETKIDEIKAFEPDLKNLAASTERIKANLDLISKECEKKLLAPVRIVWREGGLPYLLLDMVTLSEAKILGEAIKKQLTEKDITKVNVSQEAVDHFADPIALMREDGSIAVPKTVLGYTGGFAGAFLMHKFSPEVRADPSKIDMNNLPSGAVVNDIRVMTEKEKQQVSKLVRTYFTLTIQLSVLQSLMKSEQQKKSNEGKGAHSPQLTLDSVYESGRTQDVNEKNEKRKVGKNRSNSIDEFKKAQSAFIEKSKRIKDKKDLEKTHQIHVDRNKKLDEIDRKNQEDMDRDFLKLTIEVYTEKNYDIGQLTKRLEELKKHSENQILFDSIRLDDLLAALKNEIENFVSKGASLIEVLEFVHTTFTEEKNVKHPSQKIQIEKLGRFIRVLGEMS